jgi:hypothetical protein
MAELLLEVPIGNRRIGRDWLTFLPHNNVTLAVDDRCTEVTTDLIRLVNCDLAVAEPR